MTRFISVAFSQLLTVVTPSITSLILNGYFCCFHCDDLLQVPDLSRCNNQDTSTLKGSGIPIDIDVLELDLDYSDDGTTATGVYVKVHGGLHNDYSRLFRYDIGIVS